MPALMFQGTGSDVGKSLVVAGLCRALVNRGLSVKPFKPQNMSNNAAVVPGGGEIGRAQALQAKACRILPHIDMNPVLLKPQSDVGAQLVVMGLVEGNYPAKEYQLKKIDLLNIVVSRSHLNPLIKKFVEQFKNINLISIGSSIKMCYVADGTADLYPRLGPTMEWDTAAAHAIIKFAGGDLLDFDSNQSLCYNKENLLNPKFLAIANNNQSLSDYIKYLKQMVYEFSK